jgi:molybdenum cofactor cytidylyltransferase
MSYSIKYCGMLIIAAGQSKRLGTPKQLLMYEGKSLINRLIEIVKEAGTFPVTLVLGASAESIRAQLIHTDLSIILNDAWEEGMASSIRIGLTNLVQTSPALDGVMILVCDQPFISVEKIQSLLALQRESNLPIAACYYANILGTPAVFHRSIFPELLNLKGDVGAKTIIKNKGSAVTKLQVDQGVIDIDTMNDYEQLLKARFIK